jgi:hypothetical protein
LLDPGRQELAKEGTVEEPYYHHLPLLTQELPATAAETASMVDADLIMVVDYAV